MKTVLLSLFMLALMSIVLNARTALPTDGGGCKEGNCCWVDGYGTTSTQKINQCSCLNKKLISSFDTDGKCVEDNFIGERDNCYSLAKGDECSIGGVVWPSFKDRDTRGDWIIDVQPMTSSPSLNNDSKR